VSAKTTPPPLLFQPPLSPRGYRGTPRLGPPPGLGPCLADSCSLLVLPEPVAVQTPCPWEKSEQKRETQDRRLGASAHVSSEKTSALNYFLGKQTSCTCLELRERRGARIMASVNRDGATGSLRSSMACLVCRKRKIKCGRELPRCSFCDLSCQDCSYPQRSRKPGPKIGSSQAVPRKRAHASISSLLQGRPERNSSQRPGELGGANFRSASSDADLESNALNDSNEAIQSLSFIIHPSHESCSPEQRPRDAPAGVTTAGREATLLGVCLQSLGITYDHLDRMCASPYPHVLEEVNLADIMIASTSTSKPLPRSNFFAKSTFGRKYGA